MMVIVGHKDIPYKPLYYVESVEEIKTTPAGSTLWLGSFAEAKELVKHCFENGIEYAVTVESAKEAIFANALHAKFIVCNQPLSTKVQKIAETYLFDAKIMVPVNDESEIEGVAEAGVDGVIFPDAVVT